ncbi:hypothetical protein [Kineosporia succinea]|uniref:Uncharacterized protein n=1 Tax=Kineosporia succinea TaxID=84632 RepID=A0ABT9NXU9_9ACTN|nr:hypothetical protein [Kineosporia succinea]MDP9825263.1 hypothetical protein [Kineosporia succinea]
MTVKSLIDCLYRTAERKAWPCNEWWAVDVLTDYCGGELLGLPIVQDAIVVSRDAMHRKHLEIDWRQLWDGLDGAQLSADKTEILRAVCLLGGVDEPWTELTIPVGGIEIVFRALPEAVAA